METINVYEVYGNSKKILIIARNMESALLHFNKLYKDHEVCHIKLFFKDVNIAD